MAPRTKASSSENVFEVEYILQARITKARKSKRKEWRYLVKWAGFSREHNSWEPERNFNKTSGNMIDQFWAKVDLGDRDRTNLGQFTKIGEEFFPTNRPPKDKKRKVSVENVSAPPSKIQK
ncbi:hypothetical protein PILCRDRAFT_830507, partial [Piloderma croceum F 1598]